MSVFKNALFGMGNPLLDISVNASDELFTKYELTCPNAILAEEKHLPIYKEIQAAPYVPEYVGGGSAQNSVRVAQWMLQEPEATTFTGVVGKDATAETLRACMKADGVDAQYVTSENLGTGICGVLIKDHDRSMVTDLQAASTFKVENLEKTKDVWSQSGAYFVEGYFLTVSQDSILTLAKHAMANNKPFGFSLSAPFICEFFTAGVQAVLPYASYVFANETEAETLGKALKLEGKTFGELALAISQIPMAEGVTQKRKVIVTCGADDVFIAYDGKVESFAVPKLPKEELVDTNGAGDAFAGGFMAAVIKGKDDKVATDAGCYAAQVIIRTSGTKLSGKPEFKF